MVPSSQTFVLKTGLLADGSGAAAKSGHEDAVASLLRPVRGDRVLDVGEGGAVGAEDEPPALEL